MFKIYDGRETFYQWDINQKLIVDDDSITEVHFSNRTNSYSLVCDIQNEGDLRVVSVPNVLLQTNWPIKVYAYLKDHTEVYETFKVIEKDKPEDYVYTPDEVKTWEELNDRVTALEKPAESVLYTAQELTEEQKAQARQNIGAQDENNGLTPVTVTYINPFYNTTDTSTTYLLQGTLKVFDDNSPTDVKKAFAIVMNVLGGHSTPTGAVGCRDLFDRFRILYDNGLITIPFKAYPNKYDRNYWVSLSAYQNKYIFFNCVRSDKADGFNVTLRYDLETNAYEENSCYSEQAVKSSLKGLTGTPTILQVQIQSDPTTDKEIATKHYVDNAPIKKASATELGGIKVGTGLAIADDGTLSINSASAAGLTPVSYSCTDGTYSVSDTVYLESGNIISPTDTVSNDVRIAFRFINSWNIANQLDYWKNDIKKYKLLIDNGYLENNTIWYSKPDKKFKKQIRFATHNTLGDYIVFNFNYNYEVIGQIVYYVDTDTISTGTDTYVNRKLTRDKNNVLSYSAIKLSSDPTEPMQIATKQYVDNSIAAGGTDISLGLTSASVGQTIKVKAVDESGKPTAWEAVDMPSGESSFPKFEKLLTHTITEEEIATNPAAFMWNTTQIPNLNDFNVFTLTIRNPDNTTNITFTKWVKLKINNVVMGNICGTPHGESYKYSISANRLYGFWVSDNMYNPNNDDGDVLTPPYLRGGFDSNLAASDAVTSIGFTSYGGDYGLTAGIVVEIWGAK